MSTRRKQWRSLSDTRIPASIVLCLFTIHITLGFSPHDRSAWISGRVTDAVTGCVIPGVRLEVRQRRMESLPDGTVRLEPIEESQPFIQVEVPDPQGTFRVKIPHLARREYLVVVARAEGYEELWDVLVPVQSGRTSQLDLALIRQSLDVDQMEVLNQRRERERGVLLQSQPWLEQSVDARRWVTTSFETEHGYASDGEVTYPVPESVYVTDLAGFTGWINFDEYLTGVVSLEMGDGFPFEALKEQAVAARTYALERFNRTGVANGGQAYTTRIGNKSRNAVINTSPVVILTHQGLIVAFYSARCNGDFTLNGENGLSGITTCIVGGLGAAGLSYVRSRPCSGHVNCSQTNERCCHVFVEGRNQHLYGHGVGMCQRGAQQLAGRDGLDWQSILNRYYTGVGLANGPGLTVGDAVATTATLNVRDAPCGGTIATMPTGSPGSIVDGPCRPQCDLSSSYTYLTWWDVLYSDGTRGWSVEDYLRKTQVR